MFCWEYDIDELPKAFLKSCYYEEKTVCTFSMLTSLIRTTIYFGLPSCEASSKLFRVQWDVRALNNIFLHAQENT